MAATSCLSPHDRKPGWKAQHCCVREPVSALQPWEMGSDTRWPSDHVWHSQVPAATAADLLWEVSC